MSQPTIVLACPTCERTCRTQRETRPGARMRCPGCNGVFRFFVHGNGAVELRSAEPRPGNDEGRSTESRLPPRLAEQDETKGTRTIFTSRRRNRPIGGYLPFEKSRSYIGTFALWTFLGLGSLVAYLYCNKIDEISTAPGRGEKNLFQNQDEAKRKAHQERRKRAEEAFKKQEELKKRQAKGQAAEAKVEGGRLPGDQTHD